MSEPARFVEISAGSPSTGINPVVYYPTSPVASPVREMEPDAPPVPLSHYLWVLRRHRWRIVGFVAICVLLTFVVSARLRPLYEATAIIDVDREAPSEVVGDNSNDRRAVPADAEQFLATQVQLIESDGVLRPVAERFQLLKEEGQLKHLSADKQQRLALAPIKLKRLKVTRPPNTYLLLISYRSPDPGIAAQVANSIATSYLNHSYEIRIRSTSSLSAFMEKQLDELRAKMERSSLALAQFEKDLDVVNPEEKTNILSARLMQLNTSYTAAQADRVDKEAAWNAMKAGTLEAAQVSSQGQDLEKLDQDLHAAQVRFALVKSTYGTAHPEYRKAAADLAEIQKQIDTTKHSIEQRIEVQYREAVNREDMLRQEVTQIKGEWDGLNARSFEYQSLKREADADKTLYDELVRKIKEADINAGFQDNNIRVADSARPPLKHAFPNIPLNLVLSLIFSFLLAIGAALLHDSLDTTLRDPKEASRFLGVEVIGAIPSDRGSSSALIVLPAAGAAITPVPASPEIQTPRRGYYRSTSDFEESIRTIRNTILLSDFEGRLRSIVLTSATPAEGKTTVATHLAVANSDRGKKTLIVDGDLRRPSLHSKFQLPSRDGLSNVLNGEQRWQDVVVPVEGRPNLSLLMAGPGSHRAADLIGPRLSSLLDEFNKEYDLVILDAPPLLGFAECLQMATAADGVLIIARAGDTKRRAVAEVITTLKRLRANIIGVVLNQVKRDTSSEGYGYYGYYGYGRYGYSYRREENAKVQP